MTRELSLSAARRLALAAQGFDRPRPRGRVDVRHLGRVIRGLGLVQLDFVNVLVPAHYLVPFSRLGAYDRSRLDDVVYRRREFTEQWAHEASIVPMETWPLLEHRRRTHRVRPWGFEDFLEEHAQYVDWVLEEVRARGPLSADDLPDLPDGAQERYSDDWGWSLASKRQVLEAHFGFGRLAVADRRANFARVYELTERVIPAEQLERRVEPDEARRQLLLQAARACGVGTAADVADYFRMKVGEARPRLAELVETGELEEVRVEGWSETAYRHPDARLPRSIDARALIAPFDPLVWHRPRAERLFAFDYRLEIFVPAGKRRWGYYVLPFLLGERLVARVDLKAERRDGELRVRAAHRESHADPEVVAPELVAELQTLAGWLDLGAVRVEREGDLAPALAAAASRPG